MIMFSDCSRARRMLFSIVRLLLPCGDLVSQCLLQKMTSGVLTLRVSINVTFSPVQLRAVATTNSCG